MSELELFEAQIHNQNYEESYQLAKKTEEKCVNLVKSGAMKELGKLKYLEENHDYRYDMLLFNPQIGGYNNSKFINPDNKVSLYVLNGSIYYKTNTDKKEVMFKDVNIPNLKQDRKSIPISNFLSSFTMKKNGQPISDFFYKFTNVDKSKFDTTSNYALNGWNTTVEIKEDWTCRKTGNVGLEFYSYGEPSGISICESDFYLYKVHVPNSNFPFNRYDNPATFEALKNGEIEYWLIETEALKMAISSNLYLRTVKTRNKSQAESYIFPLSVIRKLGMKVYQESEDNPENYKNFVDDVTK